MENLKTLGKWSLNPVDNRRRAEKLKEKHQKIMEGYGVITPERAEQIRQKEAEAAQKAIAEHQRAKLRDNWLVG